MLPKKKPQPCGEVLSWNQNSHPLWVPQNNDCCTVGHCFISCVSHRSWRGAGWEWGWQENTKNSTRVEKKTPKTVNRVTSTVTFLCFYGSMFFFSIPPVILLSFCWRWSENYFPGLASDHDPPYLSLPSSYYYRCEPPVSGFPLLFFSLLKNSIHVVHFLCCGYFSRQLEWGIKNGEMRIKNAENWEQSVLLPPTHPPLTEDQNSFFFPRF
jgi:hypothetical protein